MDSIKEDKHLQAAIPYIMNEAKTKGLTYSNCGTNENEILEAFNFTRENVKSHGKRLGYHYKFSFSKDEKIDEKAALEFIKEWADEYLGDKYDYVCSVHSDRDHLHMHLVFNSVCRNGGKYRYEKGDWERIIKPLTNRLAEKYHTGPLKEKDKKLDYEKSKEKQIQWKQIVKRDIDKCIEQSESYDDFKRKMVEIFDYKLREGVSRENGVYLALTPPGKAKAVRTYGLGEGYQASEIAARIGKRLGKVVDSPDEDNNYKQIYKIREVWFISKPTSFIPYQQLSVYQKYFVRKMLDARRLYKGTGSTLQMREQASKAMKGITEDASFICRLNIRSDKELARTIAELSEENNKSKDANESKEQQQKKQKRRIIRKLRAIENPTLKK
ncbi:MAG: relaxase/mobilization nuclease domain-containing protein [Lachnospiraceae bacterium]|nr:relaxase/mobilization nuclease domain-containing protein [Lachnospiraceae bacterium]